MLSQIQPISCYTEREQIDLRPPGDIYIKRSLIICVGSSKCPVWQTHGSLHNCVHTFEYYFRHYALWISIHLLSMFNSLAFLTASLCIWKLTVHSLFKETHHYFWYNNIYLYRGVQKSETPLTIWIYFILFYFEHFKYLIFSFKYYFIFIFCIIFNIIYYCTYLLLL